MDIQDLLSIQRVGGVTIAKVNASELTSHMTDSLLTVLREQLQDNLPCRLVLDLSPVQFMDSIALGTLVVLLRRIKQHDGQLMLVGVGGHCRKVIEVTGLHRVFDLHDDLNAALEAMKK